jgi:predicted nucleic-acid-binding Zn-ribbon protein
MASDVHRLPASATRRLRCPKCRSLSMRRISRTGFLQEKIFPMLGYYPWECVNCRLEKLFRNRGPRKSSHSHQK